MNRKAKPVRRRVDITLPVDLVDWIDETVKEDYHFRNRSHFVEVLVERYREEPRHE